jgi:hypothetical protein
MVRMTVGFFIVAFEVWLCFRYFPKKEGIGALPYAKIYCFFSWLFFCGISWVLRYFFRDSNQPAPDPQAFFGWYAEGMSYLITTVFMFLVVIGNAGHVIRHKLRIPPQNFSEKIDDFMDPPFPFLDCNDDEKG